MPVHFAIVRRKDAPNYRSENASFRQMLVCLRRPLWAEMLVVVADAGSVALYLWRGRDHGSPGVRAGTWLAAVSQLIVVLVPVLAGAVVVLAAVAVVACAALALAALLLDRR